MKICIIGSVYPRWEDDTEVPWLRTTVNNLKKKGHDVTVYAPSFAGLRSHTIDGVPVKRFRYFFAPWETLTQEEGAPNKIHKVHYKIITLFYIFFGTIGLVWLHLWKKFDVLHVHWPAPHGIFGIAAALVRSSKVVLSFYGASFSLVKKFPFVRRCLRFFIKNADAVIAISSYTADRVREIEDRPITIVPYGATVSPLMSIKRDEDGHTIISVGRLIERKGFPFLLRAMPKVLEKIPDAKCAIIGGGPFLDDLQRLAKNLGIEDHVEIPGKVTQKGLENYFENANLFVLPSIIDSRGDTEGLGVVIIEAMNYMVPAVASDVGGIRDIVIHEKTGLLVPEKDPKALADAIVRIFNDRTLAKKLTENATTHTNEHFTWDAVTDGIDGVYRSMFKKK